MTKFRCPDCGGGFPMPNKTTMKNDYTVKCCPWCGEYLDGGMK